MKSLTHAWTPSTREEVIAVLWLIAAFQAKLAGYPFIFKLLIAKFLLDCAASIYLAVRREP